MTLFRGMLLFDIAEPPIGDWENQLGYRGMMEVWKLKDTDYVLTISAYEDSDEPCDEVWIANDSTGYWESLFFGSTEDCNTFAKKWMNEHPKGV